MPDEAAGRATPSPLLTLDVHERLRAARDAGLPAISCSLDLQRTQTAVAVGSASWSVSDRSYPYLESCRPDTIYYWTGAQFEPVARFGAALVKLKPTTWGPPTFEIDGIKMLPTLARSPLADAEEKVASVQPRGARLLDTCGGLGYFAACALAAGAAHVTSFEKNPDVLWLRSLNPWSPPATDARFTLITGEVHERIATLPGGSFDGVLHDPPRFSIAGELYSEAFYRELARVLAPGGRLFHYTGTPNARSHGRDLPGEVIARLTRVGFRATRRGDGVLAVNEPPRAAPRSGARPPRSPRARSR